MEQQQLPPPLENIISTPIPANSVVPPTTINIILPPNIVVPSSPTNAIPPPVPTNVVVPPLLTSTVPFVPSIPLQSIPQMPPLGPAPAQLPPLVHPPPPLASGTSLQSVINTNAALPEAAMPVQTQFETLSLNTPLESIAPSSFPNDVTQINNEVGVSQVLVDGNPIAPPPLVDPTAIANPNGETSLAPEEAKPGMYAT